MADTFSDCRPEWTVCAQNIHHPKKGKQKRPPIPISYSILFPGGLNAEVTRENRPFNYWAVVTGRQKLALKVDQPKLKDTWHFVLGGCEASEDEFQDEKAAMVACEQALLILCESTQTAIRAHHKANKP